MLLPETEVAVKYDILSFYQGKKFPVWNLFVGEILKRAHIEKMPRRVSNSNSLPFNSI